MSPPLESSGAEGGGSARPGATVYYPSCVVHLTLRFDPTFRVAEDGSAIQSAEAEEMLGASASSRPSRGLVIRPLVIEDNLTKIMNRVPVSGNFELNGYRQAHKFSMEFDYRDLPVDPRLCVACGVEIHLGSVAAATFGVGMTTPPAKGQKLEGILRTRDGSSDPREDTLLMAGIVDNWSVEHGMKGSTVKIEGRDLRSIFIDSPVDVRSFADLDLSQDITQVVKQIIRHHPLNDRKASLAGSGRLEDIVTFEPTDWPGQVPLSPGVVGELTKLRRQTAKQRKAPTRGAPRGVPPAPPSADSEKLSYWDLIINYCFLVGAVPFMDGYKLKIRRARNLFRLISDAGSAPGVNAPFAGGQPREIPGASKPLRIRHLVYGRNISTLRLERKYTGKTVKTVECYAVDQPVTKGRTPDDLPNQLVTGRYPTKADMADPNFLGKPIKFTPSGKPQGEEDVLRVAVPGIGSQERLKEIARDIWEENRRGDLGGSCETKSLASFGGDNSDPDLLRLKPGDPIQFLTDPSGVSSREGLADLLVGKNRRNMSAKELEDEITTRFFGDRNLARVLVATARGSIEQLERPFRVDNVKYSWSNENGVTINFDFQNYIVSLAGADLERR
jgi:hypothetical protein